MQKFCLVGDFDQIEIYEGANYIDQEKNILQDFALDYSSYVDAFLWKNLNPIIDHNLRTNALNNYEKAFGFSKKELVGVGEQLQVLNQSYNQFQPHFFQKNNVKDLTITLNAKQDEKQGPIHSKQSNRKAKDENTNKIKKHDKNQYDKNIPGNIVLTVAKHILKPNYKPQVQFYCTQLKNQSQDFDVTYSKVVYFATSIKERTHKFGTSQLGHFFHDKKANNGMYKVFGLFMSRFLKEQYTSHILSVGKMSNKYKYLEYATNMLYIPRLRKEEYGLIRQFREKNL